MNARRVWVQPVVCAGHGARRPPAFPTGWQFELCLVRRGCFRYRSRRGSVLVDPTTALFGEAGEDYTVDHPQPGGDWDTFVLLDAASLAAVGAGDLNLPTDVRTTAEVDLAHRQLAALAARRPSGPAAQELGLEVVANLLAEAEPARAAAGAPRTTRAARQAVEDARVALAADPDLSVVQLAALVGCAPHHLSRTFRRLTGVGVAAHRVALRAAEALDGLVDGPQSLAELAAACGFADHAHLTHTLARRFGLSPSALRTALTDAEQGGRSRFPAGSPVPEPPGTPDG